MIALALLAQTAAPTPPQPSPPQDWTALPAYPLVRAGITPEATSYVRGEVQSDRCRIATPATDGAQVIAPVAILVGPAGGVRQVVPAAIGCPTVEQYTVGYVIALTRGGSTASRPGWYRLSVAYRW
ncbi:hypothetical protein [Sphingomonas sp. Leaf343]|uniref:hypothetical protein n=1 Tax=Sphingomonas sp. Leaf343 TaxID=1736345 RepID=UPI0009E95BC4|nr:hypothetical protein [Sphingomonas sp. Leaf343]